MVSRRLYTGRTRLYRSRAMASRAVAIIFIALVIFSVLSTLRILVLISSNCAISSLFD